MKTFPVDLKKVSDLVSKEVVENTKFNELNTKANRLGYKIPDATTLIHINKYNTGQESSGKKMEMLIKIYLTLVT